MDPRTQERVERWDSRPFSNGYDGLSDLADGGFSGAVTAAGAWLFMLNGRIVGVTDGTIDAFEDTTGTIYEAPDPTLPLLSSMEERGGETRAKYYTNETPLEDVDETLSSNSFTGYIELSEGVLSGDYYVVYYGGRRMPAAYIGNAERLLTGDDAFERAADEVGIYEVVDVDVDVTDVPSSNDGETETDSTHATDTGGAADATPDPTAPQESDDDTAASAEVGTNSSPSSQTPPPSPGSTDSSEAGGDDVSDQPRSEAGDSIDEPSDAPQEDPSPTSITTTDEPSAEPSTQGITEENAPSVVEEAESNPAADTGSSDEPVTQPADADEEGETRDQPDLDDLEAAAEELGDNGVPWTGSEPAAGPNAEVDRSDATGDPDDAATANADGTVDGPEAEDESADRDERFKQEERWRETRRIPSIDPDNTSETAKTTGGHGSSASQSRTGWSTDERGSTSETTTGTGPQSATQEADHREYVSNRTRSTQRSSSAEGSTGDAQADEALESDMLEREDKIDQLTQRVDDLESRREVLETEKTDLERQRDHLEAENQNLTATVERLESRIGELEAELERVRSAETTAGAGASSSAGAGSGDGSETQLSAQQALTGTNVFVRYESKSQPTLQTAHEGQADAKSVASNLRLEHHTQFEEGDVSVDGQPYEEFLQNSMEYQFVDWLTGTLLYEIRDTGHANALADVYDVIPRIDRAELHASVSLEDDDTENVPDLVTFDVVAFDKRGTPLVAANLNDSRDPATREMLVELEEAASAVNANYPDLGAAIAVTSSFFDPGALEATEQATGGGFLSRGSKASYVNLSRKQGYHMCLVESRSGGFHMNVPEL